MANSRLNGFEILELLENATDPEHGLSVNEISKRTGIVAKSVRAYLNAFKERHPFGRYVDRLDEADAKAIGGDATPGWYVEPILAPSQMRLLADGAMQADADGEYVRDLVDMIHRFAGQAGRQTVDNPETPRSYNPQFPANVETLDKAIHDRKRITFNYCTYATDGSLTPRRNPDGTAREYHADPYRLTYRNGKYYLICHMSEHDGIACIHVERITNLTIENHPFERNLDDFTQTPGEPFDLARYMRERPYPAKGPAIPIHIRVTGTLEPLYDWFEHAKVRQTGERQWEAVIHANETATLWWALQYADTNGIEILAPASLRQRLHDVGVELAGRYEDKSDESASNAGESQS